MSPCVPGAMFKLNSAPPKLHKKQAATLMPTKLKSSNLLGHIAEDEEEEKKGASGSSFNSSSGDSLSFSANSSSQPFRFEEEKKSLAGWPGNDTG